MNIGLIIVGDEILSGKRQDKHLPKVIELLGARGLMLSWARYVGDDRRASRPTCAMPFASGDLVFSCGGIGATPDDHTRQCAAAALGVGRWCCTRGARPDPGAHARRGAEQGLPYEPDRPDNQHRLNMGVFPVGAAHHPQPLQQDRRLFLSATCTSCPVSR
jgi:molybdopterin-biosynthesis enzyme MoeA-like protein